jgi:gamma-glutamylcyclotransferase (GGCT)/AIG2-like uncharacterized protein YtfP
VPTDRLFVYGTLMRGFALHRLLERGAEYLGHGVVAARLYDLGAYPAAIRDPAGEVAGELYRVADPSLWPALDSAEGPQYYRGEVTVRMVAGGAQTAFIYWYRGPLRGDPIPGGDYRAHAPVRSIHHDPRS